MSIFGLSCITHICYMQLHKRTPTNSAAYIDSGMLQKTSYNTDDTYIVGFSRNLWNQTVDSTDNHVNFHPRL